MKQLTLIVHLLKAIYELLKDSQICRQETECSCHQALGLLDKQEVMAYLKITESTYYRWIRKGLLQPRGVDGQHRFFKQDLAPLFERRKYRERI